VFKLERLPVESRRDGGRDTAQLRALTP